MNKNKEDIIGKIVWANHWTDNHFSMVTSNGFILDCIPVFDGGIIYNVVVSFFDITLDNRFYYFEKKGMEWDVIDE
jgi:hypothetical protein